MLYINFIITLVALLLASFNFFKFEIWSQIEYINSIAELNYFEPSLLVHLPRFLVVAPSYYIGRVIDINENNVFTIYVVLLASLTSLIWLKVQRMLLVNAKKINYSFIIPFILLFFINGRFMFALFGLSLLMMGLIKLKLKLIDSIAIGQIIISFLYVSVSSGTFSVAVLFLIITSWRLILRSLLTGNLFFKFFKIISVILFSAILSYFLILFLQKNLDFYGGGFVGAFNILSHGLGLVLNPAPVLENCTTENGLICLVSSMFLSYVFLHAISIAFFIIFFFVFFCFLYYWKLHLFAKQAIVVSLVGGFFGFTTLMSIIFCFPIILNRAKLRYEFR